MHLREKNLKALFIVASLLALFLPTLFPSMKLGYFFPPIVVTFYQRPLSSALWFSMAAGVFIDLLSDQQRIGLTAAIYILTTLIIYPQRVNFFADKISTLPLMVFFYGFTASSIEAACYSVAFHLSPFSMRWIVTDLVVMPAFDALYGFLLVVFPSLIFSKRERKGRDYFMN